MRSLILAAAVLLVSCNGAEEPEAPHVPEPPVFLGSGAQVERDALTAYFDQAIADGVVPGLSVAMINDGEIVFSHVAGLADREAGTPVQDDTLFEAASLSKPLFGALTVSLASEGLLDLNTPLAEYMPHPDLEGFPEADVITASMVLSHQTGLPNWRRNEPDGLLNFAFEPGTSYRYSGEGYEYLADVLMHLLEVDEAGLDAIVKERITAVSGAQDTHFLQSEEQFSRKALGYQGERSVPLDRQNNEGTNFGAAWSVHSNAVDYAKVMQALMNGDILSDEEAATFFAGQGVSFPPDEEGLAFGLSDWALGFSVYETPVGRIYTHGGNNWGYTNIMAINPETGWGCVLFTNENQANDFMVQTLFFFAGMTE